MAAGRGMAGASPLLRAAAINYKLMRQNDYEMMVI